MGLTEEKANTILVAQALRVDPDGTLLNHSSLRIILTIEAITGLRIWTQDVDQSYIQSDENFKNPIYLRPSKILQLAESVIWKLINTFHGFCDTGDYLYIPFCKHLMNELKLFMVPTDRAMYISRRFKCPRALDLLVNYIIGCGDDNFIELTSRKVFHHV